MDDERIVFDRKAGRKWLTLFVLLTVVAVLAAIRYFGGGHHAAETATAAASSPAAAQVAPALINPLLEASGTTPGREVALAELRSDIFDAPDVLAAVRRAASTGTADQKGFAAEASRECWAATHVPIPMQQLMGEAAPPAAAKTEAQRLAQDDVMSRCAGFARMTRESWVATLDVLDAQAAASTTDLGHLKEIIRRAELRPDIAESLREDELQTIQAALYGDDTLLRKYAFLALLGAPDARPSGEGGSGRRDNLIAALGDQTIQPSQSQLEALEALASGPSAAAAPALDADAAAASTSARERYRDAFARKRPVRELLSLP